MSRVVEEKRERPWSDRRTAKRLKHSAPIEVQLLDGGEGRPPRVFTAELVDMSLGGILFQSERPLPEKSRFRLKFCFQPLSLVQDLDAAMVWGKSIFPMSNDPKSSTDDEAVPKGTFHCGVKFTHLTNDDIAALGSYVDLCVSSRHTRRITPNRRRYDYFEGWLSKVKEMKAGYVPRVAESGPDSTAVYDGKNVIQLCSNNGLGLSLDPRVIAGAKRALENFGTGCGGSRLISGNLVLQKTLESELSRFLGFEDALVFMTGYMGNVGLIESLTNTHDPHRIPDRENAVTLFTDHENHRSIIHGCQLAQTRNQAVVRTYDHLDMNQLEDQLKATHAARKIIITEGVFSMIGDIAPLGDIVSLARRYNALVYVDDAHAIGYLGKTGKGTLEHLGVSGVDILLGTFSKAFGAAGGFVVSKNTLCDYLRLQTNTYIFTSALPPATVGGVLEAIRIVEQEPELRETFWSNVAVLKKGLIDLGFDLLGSQTHITPIFIGPEEKATRMAETLFSRGVFIPAVRWPAVGPGRAILRCMVSAKHTPAQLAYVIEELGRAGREEGII